MVEWKEPLMSNTIMLRNALGNPGNKPHPGQMR